jgi:hypothetical protein
LSAWLLVSGGIHVFIGKLRKAVDARRNGEEITPPFRRNGEEITPPFRRNGEEIIPPFRALSAKTMLRV